MAIAENIAHLRFAIQAAKGTPSTVSAYGVYLAGGTPPGVSRTDETYEETSGLRMRNDKYVSEVHAAGTFEAYVMPLSIGALLYAALGAKAVTGATDPYTHTFTVATSRPWLTFWKSIGALLFERSADCKVNTLTISGESGKPLRVTAEVLGLNPVFKTAAEATATIEVTNRMLHYHGTGALMLEGAAVADIRAFQLVIANNGEIIPGDSLTGIDVSEGELTAQLTITKLFLATSMRNRLFYGVASPADNLAAVSSILELSGTPSVSFKFLRATAPERSLEIQLHRVALAPYDITPGTGNSPLTEGITLDCLQPAAGTTPITAKVLNAQATYAAT